MCSNVLQEESDCGMKSTKIVFLLSGLLVCLVAGLLLFLRTSNPAGEILSCDESHFDMGRIPVVNGKAIGTHKYKIFNRLERDVEIEKVVASCACVSHGKLDKIPAKGMPDVATVKTCATPLDSSEIAVEATGNG